MEALKASSAACSEIARLIWRFSSSETTDCRYQPTVEMVNRRAPSCTLADHSAGRSPPEYYHNYGMFAHAHQNHICGDFIFTMQ